MATWLFKTEPGEFSFADLQARGASVWDGVSNPAAVQHLRRCAVGDEVLVYHTGSEKAVVGLARVTAGPREDPKRPGLTEAGEVKFAVVTIAAVKAAAQAVTLAQVKADKALAGFDLVRLPRLSVMAVPTAVDRRLRALAGL